MLGLRWSACKPSYTRTPGNMSLLNYEIYSCWRVSMVADTELILLIAHHIWQTGSILGVSWVRRNQTTNVFLTYQLFDISIILTLPHFEKKNILMFNTYVSFIFKETSWISITESKVRTTGSVIEIHVVSINIKKLIGNI